STRGVTRPGRRSPTTEPPMMEENPRCHDFIRGLTEIVSAGGPKPEMGGAVKRLVTSFLAPPGSLPERCLVTKPDCYARHLLHVDPAGRFSVVVMVWGPGQRTPIHAHGGGGGVGRGRAG